MFSKRDRVISLLQDAQKEIDLLMQMSKDINTPVAKSSSALIHLSLGMMFSVCETSCPMSMEMWMQKVSSIQSRRVFPNCILSWDRFWRMFSQVNF